MAEPVQGSAALDTWRAVEVRAEAFPRAPYGDDEMDTIADAVHAHYGDDCPGVGMTRTDGESHFEFTFHDEVAADGRAGQVAAIFAGCGVEAANIFGRVIWTVMQ